MRAAVATFWKPKWLVISLLVIAGAAGMVRLGFWQLDRLQQRRASNARIIAQMNAPFLDLGQNLSSQPLTNMQYRPVEVTGTFDYSQQVYLKNKVWENQLGVHLLTPLKIQGSNQAVLVDRGWIPFSDAVPDKVGQYDPPGPATVTGIIQLPQSEPGFGMAADPPLVSGQTKLESWVVVNISRIQNQVDLPLLPVYILQSPNNGNPQLPYKQVSTPDLTDGPHLSYAIQWFSFATILLIGYPFILKRRLSTFMKQEHVGE